jgi:hypothetical protein
VFALKTSTSVSGKEDFRTIRTVLDMTEYLERTQTSETVVKSEGFNTVYLRRMIRYSKIIMYNNVLLTALICHPLYEILRISATTSNLTERRVSFPILYSTLVWDNVIDKHIPSYSCGCRTPVYVHHRNRSPCSAVLRLY